MKRKIFIKNVMLITYYFLFHTCFGQSRLMLPEGHTSDIVSVEFSPNGKKIVTASWDKTAKVWDVKTGKLLISLEGHSSHVRYANFSPDGNKILTASLDNTAKIWNAETGKQLFSFDGNKKAVTFAQFSPDGKRVIIKSSDYIIRIFDAYNGNLLKKITNVESIAFNPKENWLLTVSKKGKIKIWKIDDADNIKLFKTLSMNDKSINNSISLNYDGTKVLKQGYNNLFDSDGTIAVWDLPNKKPLHDFSEYHNGCVDDIISPNGSKIVALNEYGNIVIIDIQSGDLIDKFDNERSYAVFYECNEKSIISISYNSIQIWDIETKSIIHEIDNNGDEIDFYNYNAKSNKIACVFGNIVKIWDIQKGELISTLQKLTVSLSNIHYLDSTNLLLVSDGFSTAELDLHSGNIITEYNNVLLGSSGYISSKNKEIFASGIGATIVKIYDKDMNLTSTFRTGKLITILEFSTDGKNIFYGNSDGSGGLWDIEKEVLLYEIKGHINAIISADFSTDERYIITSGNDKIIFWNYSNGNRITDLILLKKLNWIWVTPDKYYFSTKDANKMMYWIVNNINIYPFEQFDLKYNRPDIVLSRLGYADSSLIEAYHKAYLKRLMKMGFKEKDLGDDFHIPESAIGNFDYMPVIEEKDIEIDLNFKDSKYKLDRYNIWINDVPIFGTYGKSLRALKTDQYSTTERIILSEGNNKIQVSCLNEKGAESYKETEYISYEPKENIKPDLYLIPISVSNYQDKQYNLDYAVKDGRDIVKTLCSNTDGYNRIFVDSLFNQNATRENILAIKDKLLKSNVDDQVILFISGHGLLDKDYNFWFATHDMDFEEMGKRGVSYTELEWLLDSIPARKKLFLMDACHSGEIDKETFGTTVSSEKTTGEKQGNVTSVTFRGANSNYSSGLGLQNSFELMQELFVNLNRGSGAQVISAAAGNSYALESDKWQNGVFTYSLLSGLVDYAADANNDKQITISELKEYVGKEVVRLTNGAQKPTSRQENVEFDFRVW